MTIMKRILSLIGLILGVIGMLLCLAVIIGAWWVNPPITNGLLQVFTPIETALAFGDAAVGEFNEFVADTQTQVTAVTDAKPIATALEGEIQQVAVYVDVANALVGSAEQTVTDVAESVQPGVQGTVISHAVDRLLETLTDVTDTLDAAETLAQEIKDSESLLGDEIDALNEQLDALQSGSANVSAVINQTANDVASIKDNVPRWIDLGSLIVTLIFIWFGMAQYFLFRSCWRILRKPTS
ncbi:MAG: hypothetical protein AAF639_24290 [Chloroflexota bacterium]